MAHGYELAACALGFSGSCSVTVQNQGDVPGGACGTRGSAGSCTPLLGGSGFTSLPAPSCSPRWVLWVRNPRDQSLSSSPKSFLGPEHGAWLEAWGWGAQEPGPGRGASITHPLRAQVCAARAPAPRAAVVTGALWGCGWERGGLRGYLPCRNGRNFTGERRAVPFPAQGKPISVGYTERSASYVPAAPWPGSLGVKFPPAPNVFALTVNLRGESAGMEKLTQPLSAAQRRCWGGIRALAYIRLEAFPFLSSKLHSVALEPPFTGGASFGERGLVKRRSPAALPGCSEFPHGHPGSSVQQPRVLQKLSPSQEAAMAPLKMLALTFNRQILSLRETSRSPTPLVQCHCCQWLMLGTAQGHLTGTRCPVVRTDGPWNFLPALLLALC